MADRVYWLGLLTDTGVEPGSATGYARARFDFPETTEYTNTVPILFCPARLPWPVVTQAALYAQPDPASPRLITSPLLAPPAFSVPTPLAVDESEEAEIPPYWLTFRWLPANTPRPFGLYRFGAQAFGTWPTATEVQFRVGAVGLPVRGGEMRGA